MLTLLFIRSVIFSRDEYSTLNEEIREAHLRGHSRHFLHVSNLTADSIDTDTIAAAGPLPIMSSSQIHTESMMLNSSIVVKSGGSGGPSGRLLGVSDCSLPQQVTAALLDRRSGNWTQSSEKMLHGPDGIDSVEKSASSLALVGPTISDRMIRGSTQKNVMRNMLVDMDRDLENLEKIAMDLHMEVAKDLQSCDALQQLHQKREREKNAEAADRKIRLLEAQVKRERAQTIYARSLMNDIESLLKLDPGDLQESDLHGKEDQTKKCENKVEDESSAEVNPVQGEDKSAAEDIATPQRRTKAGAERPSGMKPGRTRGVIKVRDKKKILSSKLTKALGNAQRLVCALIKVDRLSP